MDYPRSTAHMYRAVFWSLLFLCVIGTGIFILRGNLVPFFLTRPVVNGAILIIGLVGILIGIAELVRLVIQARHMNAVADRIREDDTSEPIPDMLESEPKSLARDRSLRVVRAVERDAQSAGLSASVLSDADVEAEEGRAALVPYLIGVMVFLGLIGTFWGLLVTVTAVKDVLQALEPTNIDDPTVFLTQLKSSIGGLLGGMSTAFSTSLFGLGGSVILGFVEVQTRQARSRFLADLDRFVVSVVIPRAAQARPTDGIERPVPAGGGGQLYQTAFQEALAGNLRQLRDTIALQTSAAEKTTSHLVDIKDVLENLREDEAKTCRELQGSVQVQSGALDRLDAVARQLDKVFNETRSAREATETGNQAFLDRLKLEGEITNKTLSIGFSDLSEKLQEIVAQRTHRQDPEKES